MIKYFFLFLIVVSCTKDLETQINALEVANDELKNSLNQLLLQMDSYEAQIAILEYQLSNPEVSFDSPYIGCWTSTESVYETEIQILPNGVGTLDFGTSVYQVFSWGVYEGETILHFGDVSWCSCFGITSEGFLFGEMFEENQSLAQEDEDEFTLVDFNENTVSYSRCSLL
jgi:hypothetical protein